MGSKRASLTAVAAVAGVLLVVVVTWAASIGPSGILTGQGPVIERSEPTDESPTTPEPIGQDPDLFEDLQEGAPEGRPLLGYAALALMVAGALFVLGLLYRAARSAWDEHVARRRPPAPVDERDFDVLPEPTRVAREIGRDAAEQRTLLLGGSPRNGIVECWHRFELQAEAAGLARRPSETSSEFTLRMLDLVDADTDAVGSLAALYREARFSGHRLDEEARARAVTALDAVHAGLLRSRT